MYRSTRTLVVENIGFLVIGLAAFAALWTVLLRPGPVDYSSGVLVWWTALCALGIVNICGWRLSAAAVARRRDNVEPAVYLFQRRQLLLSAVYVVGCAFRSILPRADVQR